MKKSVWPNMKLLILGFGREGQATLRYLLRCAPTAKIGVADKRGWEELSDEERKMIEGAGVEKMFGEDYLEQIRNYQYGFISPGISKRRPEIQKLEDSGMYLTTATDEFFRAKEGEVIAVTGSKGKSTTASLIYAVLKEAGENVELIGNIGKPALDYLENDEPTKIYVFEMSSYQLEDFLGGAEMAVIVSLFPEHLDYHGSLENYYRAKMRVVGLSKAASTVVWNAGNATLKERIEGTLEQWKEVNDRIENRTKVEPLSLPYNDGEISMVKEDENGVLGAWVDGDWLVKENEINLKGRHNLENILGVYEVALNFGVRDEVFLKAVKSFQPLEHRLERVGNFGGITFYDDAISTTPESTMAAIEALSRQKRISTLIAGGMDRGYDFQKLAEKILEAGIKNLILLPETGKAIAEEVKKIAASKKLSAPLLSFFGDMESCVAEAFKLTEADTICLLSCASPSYNLFKNFEERGRRFKDAVRKG